MPGQSKVFALSRSGKLYVFSPDSSLHSASSPASTSGNSNWLSYFTSSRTQDIPHVELEASGGLSWGEKWKQVAVGSHHLLALTTKGRLFSMPLSEKEMISANSERERNSSLANPSLPLPLPLLPLPGHQKISPTEPTSIPSHLSLPSPSLTSLQPPTPRTPSHLLLASSPGVPTR